jgi:aryl-alcohol dehydrogenase-like predicted oxidoreductase
VDYRTLGGSGCAVSGLALGTMTFGAETGEPEAHRMLDRFLEAGGTLVDTADTYGEGRSEEIIGRWFASRPSEVTGRVVLATKGRFPLEDAPNAAGRGVTMAEIALAWVTGRPAVSSTILGARGAGQLEANLQAADLHLTAQETAELDAASDPRAPGYPYGEMGAEQRSRRLAGGR